MKEENAREGKEVDELVSYTYDYNQSCYKENGNTSAHLIFIQLSFLQGQFFRPALSFLLLLLFFCLQPLFFFC